VVILLVLLLLVLVAVVLEQLAVTGTQLAAPLAVLVKPTIFPEHLHTMLVAVALTITLLLIHHKTSPVDWAEVVLDTTMHITHYQMQPLVQVVVAVLADLADLA
jgi:hypothetical protein